ncbi:IF-2B-domain-containing protein [Neoconidiobolus thromboides FSU 785]|nr:IF-2B-domain-containing protein [Neoconidiobolus thromboides FSU 785]
MGPENNSSPTATSNNTSNMTSPAISNIKSPQPSENNEVRKSNKEMTKAERRALQEKQRAEKEAKKQGSSSNTISKQNKKNEGTKANTTPSNKSLKLEAPMNAQSKDKIKEKSSEASKLQGLSLFKHLETSTKSSNISIKDVHPAIIELASQFKDYLICGSNARCIAMLQAFKQVITDYMTPPHTPLCRHLVAHLSPQITYLVTARPMSVTMGNAIRYLKTEISTVDPDLPEDQAKKYLCESIDQFIIDRITAADVIIAENAMGKIKEGDVIMIYGSSSVVLQVLESAIKKKIQFRVIVVDAGPRFEGKHMLRKLVELGIECSYILLHGVAYIAKEATKVFLGAHGLFSNGTLLSRAGTAIVAMTGYDQKIPVIVCCETYKFSEKVQLDSIVWNEIGNPEDLITTNNNPFLSNSNNITDDKFNLESFKTMNNVFGLNLLYDLTPPHYISMVITEVGMIPCTSVPVVLREYGTLMQ